MTFNDDEEIVLPAAADQENSAETTTFPPSKEGKVKARVMNKNTAPLDETPNFKVLIELTGVGSANGRPGVDLVTVLDVSGSMRGDRINKLKKAMLFVIKKLSPIDRLSVVTFSDSANRECSLRQMNENAQTYIENLVNGLKAGGNTNITSGLQTALQVLKGRRFTGNRTAAIMLMSDGEQNRGGDASQVSAGDVPVYTFGLGDGHDPKVLKAIADNSKGGTYSVVPDTDNLSIVFSQCLAGLLTVLVQDLELTIEPTKPVKIQNVSAGNYPKSEDNKTGAVTISFGDLYIQETRKTIVDLLLPVENSNITRRILEFGYSYSTGQGPFEEPPIDIRVTRTGKTEEKEREEVTTEESRLRTAQMMKEAREMADKDKLEDAKDKLMAAQNLLEDVEVDDENQLIEMLKTELQQLLDFMKSKEIYLKQGRPFALSSETSHARQRFAARGDVEQLRLFATPRMDAYLKQAKAFDEDPSKPIPTADEDVKQELAADPLAPIIGPLSYYIQTAIRALQSIDNILHKRN